MNNTTIISKLNNFKKTLDFKALDDLIHDLQLEALSNGFKPSKTKANKKALAYLKKAGGRNNTRPALNYSTIIDYNNENIQVFTDSYTMFKLKEHYILPDISERPELTYPNVKRLIPDASAGESCQNAGDIEKFLAGLKANVYKKDDETDCFTSESYKVHFDVNRLKQVIEILGTLELKVNLFGSKKPNLFVDESTGNEAILLPVRKY